MLAFLFVVLAVVLRFLPHAWHFTPVGAALLFFGATRPRKDMWFPVAMLAGSDIALNVFVYQYPVTFETFSSTLFYILALGLGSLLKEDRSALRIAGASLAGSFAFFLISNFAVWAVYNMYPKDFNGLVACYAAAIPFFRGTFVADLVFTAVIFSLPMAIESIKQWRAVENTSAA